MAACIALAYATSMDALRRLVFPNVSASAIARADAVKFTILELAADSVRSSTEANWAVPARVRYQTAGLLRVGLNCQWQADNLGTDGGLVLAGLTPGNAHVGALVARFVGIP